jgi:SAM-dependent methyltransferase
VTSSPFAGSGEAGSAPSEFEFLLASARRGKAQGLDHCVHLDQPIGIWNYIRIADDIARQVPSHAELLDWGCGYGQMSYLLRRRGLSVTSFDVGEASAEPGPDLALGGEHPVVRTSHPTALPFPDACFDAVLSCGVLEHVDEFSAPGNERASLEEIARVLRPGGTFLIYQLPQRYAWQEAIIRRLRLGYAHPRRYTIGEITKLLRSTGYTVRRVRRANLLPKNLTGMPEGIRSAYSRMSRALIGLDGRLCAIPGLDHLAGVLEITARRDRR